MITYKRFWHWCLDNNINKTYLHEVLNISWPTISKMVNDEYVKLQTLEKICEHFNIGFDNIMQIKRP